ncbi:MAG TPA: hypothetical protein VF097_09935 [Actinomycetota bacterium]
MGENGCELTHGIAAELALGVALGEERDRALRHVEECASCRRGLVELGELVDELMLLAPEREPPVGFESRVVSSATQDRRPPRWRRFVASVAAAAIAAAATGTAAHVLTRDERTVAAQFRTALTRAGGQYFGVEFLHEEGGGRAGHVFVYRGDVSWAFVVPSGELPGSFRVEMTTRDGRTLEAGGIDPAGEGGGAGLVLPVDLEVIESIRLIPVGGGDALEAHMPEPPEA